MKSRVVFLSVSVISLSVFLLGGCASGKYVPKASEELYGTWTSEQAVNDYSHPQKAVVTADGYKHYIKVSDSVPSEEGTEQINSKWTDTEGSIWYKTFGAATTGQYKGYKYQALVKLSKSGTVQESVFIAIGFEEFDPKKYPTKIDPTDSTYKIQYRAKE